jgi:diadenosine tetraphosphate (Ap4A) HIT family hydrolase
VYCPFCNPPADRIIFDRDEVLGLRDAYPVSPGHALVIPRRHVSTWFDATPLEKSDLVGAIDAAKAVIEQDHQPDGYNIGINCGAAAGQTIFHLHIHLIPRYTGDVAEPRGGVRHVIAEKANYLPKSTSDQDDSPSR